MKTKLVIFDFDGVIVDTMPIWFEINKKTNPNFTYEQFQKMAHGNSVHAFQSGNYENFVVNPDSHAEYAARLEQIEPRIEIENAIRSLSAKYILIIISSGSELNITNFIQKAGLSDCFSDILGFQTHANKTEKIKIILEKHNIDPKDAVFVTDALGDVIEGKEAGVHVVGETWGIHDRETLELGKPEIIIDDPKDLKQTIETILDNK
jgi:phosphoglycolate phosphatase